MQIKLFLPTLAIIALCAGCVNRASTTSHVEKTATNAKETATEREIHHEQASTNQLYTTALEYDSLLIEKDTAGGVRLRIYNGKQAAASALLKNEEAGYERQKEMDITINDSSDIAKTEDAQTAVNSHTPKQIESKTGMLAGYLKAILAAGLLILLITYLKKR
jgi:opacity protein-like surface antigen